MKKQLENLRNLALEYKTLKAEYDRLQAFPTELVADTVNDYSTGYPHTVKIEGYGDTTFLARKERLERELRKTLNSLMEQRIAIEDFIRNIDDTKTRTIIRLYYVHGLTQQQIADGLGITQQAVSKVVKVVK